MPVAATATIDHQRVDRTSSEAQAVSAYTAKIDIGGVLRLRLSPDRTKLVHLAIKMLLSCDDGTGDTFRTSFLSATDTEAMHTGGHFLFHGTAGADSFITGGNVFVAGRLKPRNGPGIARMVENSRDHGRCDSGIGHWKARPS